VAQKKKFLDALTPEERAEFYSLVRSGGFAALCIVGIYATLLYSYWGRQYQPLSPPSLEDRIASLTASLNDAASTISEIEIEVNKRRALLEDLKRDASVAAAVGQLNQQQMDAIGQRLRIEFKNDKRTLDWVDIAKSLLFTALGVFLGEIVGWWKQHRKRSKAGPVDHEPQKTE
jgi:hypothetical protein